MATSEHLKRLASTFTVRDIMVRIEELVCADDESEAASLSRAHPDFNIIPIRAEKVFSAYYSRDSKSVSAIDMSDLIGDGTGILDIVEVLSEREFAFVLGPRYIDGYVHYSDLNRNSVKFVFYVLLEGVERFALDSLGPLISDVVFLRLNLGEQRFRQVRQSYERAGNARQSLANYLNIGDSLRLARAGGKLEIEDGAIQAVTRVRNGAAHVLENLVSDYEDVRKLAQVKSLCFRILGLYPG